MTPVGVPQNTHVPQKEVGVLLERTPTGDILPVWNLGIQDLHPLIVRVEVPNYKSTSHAVERNRKVPHA